MIPTAFLQFRSLVASIAAQYGYDAPLLAAQAHQESRWNPDAKSPAGATGLMQFMPATWREYGRGGNPTDPQASLDAGVRYMRYLLGRYGDQRLALAAYNCGPGNLEKAMKRAGSKIFSEVSPFLPSETRDYVPKILGLRSLYAALGQIQKSFPPVAIVLMAIGGALLLRRLV